MIHGHGGNVHQLSKKTRLPLNDISDMSSNLNPLGPPPELLEFLKSEIDSIKFLPEPDLASGVSSFAKIHSINPSQVSAGNGTTQLIYILPKALDLKKVLILGPTYSDYGDACMMNNVRHEFFLSKDSDLFIHDLEKLEKISSAFDGVFICNPNNPTGVQIPSRDIKRIAEKNPYTVFIVDESYLPFSDLEEKESLVSAGIPNLIVLGSMSKIFRVPGLRIGFFSGPEKLAAKMRSLVPPWSVNSMAQACVEYIFSNWDEMKVFIQESRKFISREKQWFLDRFPKGRGVEFFNGSAPFVLAKLVNGPDAGWICENLEKDGILIRNCSNFTGLSDKFIRFSLKKRKENAILVQKLLKIREFE